jgi:hypothetical protein
MRLVNAVAASRTEDVVDRKIPLLTSILSGLNTTRKHSGFFYLLSLKADHWLNLL